MNTRQVLVFVGSDDHLRDQISKALPWLEVIDVGRLNPALQTLIRLQQEVRNGSARVAVLLTSTQIAIRYQERVPTVFAYQLEDHWDQNESQALVFFRAIKELGIECVCKMVIRTPKVYPYDGVAASLDRLGVEVHNWPIAGEKRELAQRLLEAFGRR